MAIGMCPYCGNPIVAGQTICDTCGQTIKTTGIPLRQQSAPVNQAGAFGYPANGNIENNPYAQQQGYSNNPQVGNPMGVRRVQPVQDVRTPTAPRNIQTGASSYMPFDAEFDLPMYDNNEDARQKAEQRKELSKEAWTLGVVGIVLVCLAILIFGTVFFLKLFNFI